MMLGLCFQEKLHLHSLVNMYNVILTDFKHIRCIVLRKSAEKEDKDRENGIKSEGIMRSKSQKKINPNRKKSVSLWVRAMAFHDYYLEYFRDLQLLFLGEVIMLFLSETETRGGHYYSAEERKAENC